MSSKYLQVHLPSRENAERDARPGPGTFGGPLRGTSGGPLRGTSTSTADTVAQASEPVRQAGAATDEKPDRFQPGMLSPLDEDRPRRSPEGATLRSRPVGLRVFDKSLLVAEVVSALVVAWLVAQYVYTAYIDTPPRRVSAPPTASPWIRDQGSGVSTASSGVRNQGSGVGEIRVWGQGSGDSKSTETQTPNPRPLTSTGLTPSVAATPTVEPALLLPGRLRIPVMFLDSPVHEVTLNMGEWEVSPMDIGHHEGTANPGETGNMVLAGHRDINSALFRELDRLKPGDEVFVSNNLREYRYVVAESFVVGPKDTTVMDSTGDKRVTLITCTPVGLATQRLIVTAILDE